MSSPTPWEKCDDESSKAYAAFCIYRDLGPRRSIANVTTTIYGGGKPGVKRGHVEVWSSRYRWVERAAAWDEHVARRRVEAFEEGLVEAAHRHAQEAVDQQRALLLPTQEILRRLSSRDEAGRAKAIRELDDLSIKDLLRLVAAAAGAWVRLAEAQREATRSEGRIRSGPPPNGDYGLSDPFQTDDEFARKVVEAWREAGILPGPVGDGAETSRNGHSAMEGGSPEATPRRHVRRSTARPNGTIDYPGRSGAGLPPGSTIG